MFPLSHVLVLRYFLMLEFIPFIMLGLMAKYFQNKFGRKGLIVWSVIMSCLFLYNTYAVMVELNSFKNGKGDVGIAIWSEEKFAGEFILNHMKKDSIVEMVYEPQNANKFIRSLAYFENSIDAPAVPNKASSLDPAENISYFTLILNRDGEKKNFKRRILKDNIYEVVDSGIFGRIAIYYLKLK